MTVRAEVLSELLVSRISDMRPGTCLRVDNLSDDEAVLLQTALASNPRLRDLPFTTQIYVLDWKSGLDRKTVEEAIAVRNDVVSDTGEPAILVLLVPQSLANEASSLDNSFNRLPYMDLLSDLLDRTAAEVKAARPSFPANELFRLTRNRTQVEDRLDFLESVAGIGSDPYGLELWRIGLLPDGGDDDSVRRRLRLNDAFVRKIAGPAGAGQAVEDRLRQTRLAPGRQFDLVLSELIAREDQLHNSREWARALSEQADLRFDNLSMLVNDENSDLTAIEVLTFRAPDGNPLNKSGLKLIDGNLVCELHNGQGRVGVKWRTTPRKTTQVHRWLVRLVHPEDIRDDQEPALVETRVAGSVRSTNLKIDLENTDIPGGYLFVVEVLPVDKDGLELDLPDSAVTQSEAFTIVFDESEVAEDPGKPKLTAENLAAAKLDAVFKGAPSLKEDYVEWSPERQLFSLRVGGVRKVQIPVSDTIFQLQKSILKNPLITGFFASSQYGLPLLATDFDELSDPLPVHFFAKRLEVAKMLLGAPDGRSIPELFPWSTEGARAAVADYVESYKNALDNCSDPAMRDALQRLDTVELSLGRLTESAVSVVLPLHPIRLAWIAGYEAITREWAHQLLQRPPGSKTLLDFDALARVAPTNVPFAVATTDNRLNIYLDELAFGVGLLVPVNCLNPEVVASTVSDVLSMPRRSVSISSDILMVADRLAEYRKGHADPKALRIGAMNPGNGAVLSGALRSFYRRLSDDQPRIDLVCYGKSDRYANPLAALTELQAHQESQHIARNAAFDADTDTEFDQGYTTSIPPSPVFPPLGLALRSADRLASDTESIHIALVSNIGELNLAPTPKRALTRLTSFHGLLCPTVTSNIEAETSLTWTVSPALKAQPGMGNENLVEAHYSQQRAAGLAVGIDGPPALHVGVEEDCLNGVRVLHERADWVMTLDRFIGLDFYEAGYFGQSTANYVLDYAPDFIDGMSHRLTITTAHRGEVSMLLKRALEDLGLDALQSSTTQVLDDLMTVSGRLILRLQGSDSFARESVGLAALVAHLRKQNKLDGAIVVPVDSHHEIFGRSAPGNEAGRRCDMLVIRVTEDKLSISCIEVKSRRYAVLPTDLADDIVDQLKSTKELLIQRYFATDPPRVDASLQRAQFAGLLHYYADRAFTNGLIGREDIVATHKCIDNFAENETIPVEINLHGYVISLGGDKGIPTKHRDVPISVLTAGDLGKIGFSVIVTKQDPDKSEPDKPEPDKPEPDETDQSPRAVHEADGSDAGAGLSSDLRGARYAPKGIADSGRTNHKTGASMEPGSGAQASSESKKSSQGADQIEVVLGRESTGTLVTWHPSTKGSPHAFIVGISGQGKSVTARRIISEMAEQGLPSLVIDFHGDMAADPPANAEVLGADEGLPFTPFDALPSTATGKIAVAAWELAEVIQFVSGLGEIQRSNVYKALQETYHEALTRNCAPTLSQFAAALDEVERKTRGSQNARERVRPLTDFGLFDEGASREFNPRQSGMVVDLSRLLAQVQVAATSFLLRRIYRDMFAWPQDGTLKLAIVLDEAHRVAKDVTLPKLMKEGRKYGVIVIVASQGLSDFNKDVIANAGMKVIFRTNYPESKTLTRYVRGREGQDLSLEIEKLDVGQAYVVTADVAQARRTQMFD